MDVVLCGERSIEWDKASLQQHIKLVSNEQGASCILFYAILFLFCILHSTRVACA